MKSARKDAVGADSAANGQAHRQTGGKRATCLLPTRAAARAGGAESAQPQRLNQIEECELAHCLRSRWLVTVHPIEDEGT